MKAMAIVLICVASLTLSFTSKAAPVEVRLSAPLGSHAYGQVVLSDPSPRYEEYRREVYTRDALCRARGDLRADRTSTSLAALLPRLRSLRPGCAIYRSSRVLRP